jgi:hypothetical protein
MKAIRTKYHGPTDTRASRITATEPDGHKVTIPWDYDLNTPNNHRAAALALRDKMGWKGHLITGSLSDSYVHVFAD